MTAADLLAELRRLDVRVSLDGERLRLNAPVGVLTEEHKRNLAMRKPEVVAFLREAQRLAVQQRAIVPLSATGTQPPIFAVPGHNGDVFAYRAMAQHLGADQPFFGLQPPGLVDGSQPLTRVEDIAGYFAEQIRAFEPVGPIIIAGYCAGGSIAFELARRLAESGTAVDKLVLFGAPYCTFYRRAHWAAAVIRHFAGRMVIHARALRAMPASERHRYLARRVRQLAEYAGEARSTAPVDDAVLMRRQAVVQATLGAARRYVPQYADIHIDCLLPSTQWQHSPARPLRWSRFARSAKVFAGPEGCSTDTMLRPEHVADFAAFVVRAQQSRV